MPVCSQITQAEQLPRIEIISQQSDAMYDFVYNRDYDLGFVAAKGYRTNIEIVPFFTMEMSIVVNCDKQKGGQIKSPLQLEPKNEIYMEYGAEIREWRRRWWPVHYPQFSIDSFQLLEQCLQKPDAWALIPTSILNRMSSKANLFNCDFGEENPPGRTCYYIYHLQNPIVALPEYRQLMDVIKSQVERDPALNLLISDVQP